MKINLVLSILFIFSIGCNKQIHKEVFQTTSFTNSGSVKKYFFQIETTKKKNGVIEAKILSEWESEYGLFELIDALVNEKEPKSIDEYKYKTKSGTIILIKEANSEFKIGEQFVIEIIQDTDSKFKINSKKTVNLDSTLESTLVQRQEERILTRNGRIINFEYQLEGKFDCKKEDLVSLIKNSNFDEETIAKEMKSLLRKRIGELLEKEIIAKLDDNSFKEEIKNEFKTECFALEEFEIKIK